MERRLEIIPSSGFFFLAFFFLFSLIRQETPKICACSQPVLYVRRLLYVSGSRHRSMVHGKRASWLAFTTAQAGQCFSPSHPPSR
ncbi:hypothetical protein LX36DRAFT_194601 [Colletotrichum falcatum]|nr:hypothetical protein LX36DRAFT_194601 [Colletotrichum falcatum]